MDEQLQPAAEGQINLKTNNKSVPLKTVENFLMIMENDPYFKPVKFNEMSGRAEVHNLHGENVDIEKWGDTHEAASRAYIEKTYGIYDIGKHADALRILFQEKRFNPVKDLVEAVEWDGQERCVHFLHQWAKVEDNDYTREVSRLIFAGGIHRLYAPGTKFDDVPILIGTKQGEGKSSLIRYLAINDEYFGEVTQMEGQQSIEQLQGKWICEISELLALTKAKDQEAVKAYITRQVDTYRQPYDKHVTDLPRRCLFVGSSNNSNPLSDKSGNRRWYPVYVNSSGYEVHDHEDEIRDYIRQCWAEAKVKYDRGEMPNFADRKYSDLYKEAQDNAMQDDWRVGAIMQFLDTKLPGDYTCVREICHKALSPNQDFPHDPNFQESKDIGMIVNKLADWEPAGRHRIDSYGQQRAWRKLEQPEGQKAATQEELDYENLQLPF